MRHAREGAVLVLVAACGASSETPAAPPSAAATASTTAATVTGSAAGLRHSVRSHCGVVSTRVGGVLWLADPPLGDNNPPPGWGENDTPGVFVERSEGEAVFTAESGVTARFVRAPVGAADPGAGCE